MRPSDLEDALQTGQVLLNKSKTVAVIVPDDYIHIVNVEHIRALTLCPRNGNAA